MDKRNTGKEKMKNNKGFPYHRLRNGNRYGKIKWKVVDCDGNIIEHFVSKATANYFIEQNQKNYLDCELRLEEI